MSAHDPNRFEEALRRIDAANAEDPNIEIDAGAPQPKELVYGRRMSAWLDRLRPDAPEALRLAVRAQHIRRWMIPRNEFPMTRAGYLKWRTRLYGFHGDEAAAILREAGYDDATVRRVRDLLRKRGLRTDPDTQALEDAACLVFLEHHFDAFARRDDMDEAKLIDILRKTWKKMSPDAHRHALELSLTYEARGLVEKALAE